jgi:putative CGCGG family rSAM target protein
MDAHDSATEPASDERHDNSWSANLEQPRHADDPGLVVEEATQAVERTCPGYHVNLVTHGDLGHPATYLYEALDEMFGGDVSRTYVSQCGCGGHVTRVVVHDT